MARAILRCLALCFCLGLFACSASKSSKDNVASQSSALSGALLGVNVDPTNPNANPSPADLAAVGASRVRIEFKTGESDDLAGAYALYDRIVDSYHAAGIGVLLIVDYASIPGFTGPSTEMPGYQDYVTRFVQRVGDIAAHYRSDGAHPGIDTLEIWNEPDLCNPKDPDGTRYCPQLAAADFALLLHGVVHAVKDANNPMISVITGGLASGAWETYATDLRKDMGDDWDLIDGVGSHPYTFWPYGTADNHLDYQINKLTEITDKQIYFTEWGDAQRQADAVQAYMSYFADPNASGIVEHIAQAYVFAWSSTQHAPPDEFGLIGRDGKPTAAWQKFRDGAEAVKSQYGLVTPPPLPPPPDNGGGGGDDDASAPAAAHASLLHGTVTAAGTPLQGITVSILGDVWQDYKEVTTDELGIYQFDGLNPDSTYNIAVNTDAHDESESPMPFDINHAARIHPHVELVAGPDGWHGEDFPLPF